MYGAAKLHGRLFVVFGQEIAFWVRVFGVLHVAFGTNDGIFAHANVHATEFIVNARTVWTLSRIGEVTYDVNHH